MVSTELVKGIQAVDLAIYLPAHETLVIADLHLGFEEHLLKQGVLVPRFQLKDTLARLEHILSKVKVDTIVLNGDVKHEFGTISRQEWRDVLKLMDFLLERVKAIIVIKGNHDTILGPIAGKRGLKEVKEYKTGGILVAHGDYVPEKLEKTTIIGHEHPAISLREKAKVERFKCFLKGKYKKSTLIVQPSFNPLIEGTDIAKEQVLSPLLKQNLDDFEVFIYNEKTREVLPFGKFKKLKK